MTWAGLAGFVETALRFRLSLPVCAKQFEQLRREHRQALLVALAIGDLQHYSLAVDIAHAQGDDFEDARPGGTGGDHGAHLAVWDAGEEVLQGDGVEETQGCDIDVEV